MYFREMGDVTEIWFHQRMERADSITVVISVAHHIQTGRPSENDGKAVTGVRSQVHTPL